MTDIAGDAATPRPGRRAARLVVRALVAVVLVVVLVLGVDLVLTHGHTARGAQIVGIGAGNRDVYGAQHVLNDLSKRSAAPVTVRTASGAVTLQPADLGLHFDAPATRERLEDQPANPVTRLLALFGKRHEVQPVVRVDRQAFNAALDAHRKQLERAAVEGGVHYRGSVPIGDLPAAGQRVARDRAVTELADHWLDGGVIDLPMEPFAPTVGADAVHATVVGAATRATSEPITVNGREHRDVRLSPDDIGSVLAYVPDGHGGLTPRTDDRRLRDLVGRGLSTTEHKAMDASFHLVAGRPSVAPSHDGARIDWTKTLDAVRGQFGTDGPRRVDAAYVTVHPTLTTDGANKLGVTEEVSEFTTGGFSGPSGENIRLVAEAVNGALVKPGDTFSLNGYTGPRGTAQGYVTSTIIDHGRPAKAVGGGISQFATTLYNASYFAGLDDVDHTEHSYYISRYPEAREATVFEGAIDLKFGNNSGHGIYIETNWTPSSVTVRMWGTKTVDVRSITGKRHDYTNPDTVTRPRGNDCIADSGQRGFTTSNTRVIADARSGAEVSKHTRTVKYDSEPVVRCT